MADRARVLVVDDEPNILKTIKIGLEAIGLYVDGFLNPVDAVEQIAEDKYDIAFIDLMMQPIDGMQVLKEIRAKSPLTTAVIITAHGSIDSAVEAIKAGAFDFLQKPFDLKELQLFTEKVLDHHNLQTEVNSLRRMVAGIQSSSVIITRNNIMQQQLELARQVADSSMSVLIEGESGTGKEMVAQFIHDNSNRKLKPLVKVNCAALPENLIESELFGHVKGAFTGAIKDREGRFEVANEGTIFLDEIADIPPSSQVKLLRFLQHREFERVGENITRKVDVRVIAATNRRLADSLKDGSFREDLYYRLNAVRISLPPLRERSEDIILLIYHFIKKFSNTAHIDISAEAMKLLTSYSWPGNVRELENIIERAVLLAKQGTIEVSHLPPELQNPESVKAGLLSLEAIERYHISRVLKVVKDLDEAARILHIDPATLWRKRKKYGLHD
ncbi:MAG: sigma-54-dependent Fis family transcriptional regulator [Ignavibacteriales bacterium]|nr:sigma-54-dependent Fis family transcriptional regulator [Ignavibacteriales bacterium]